MAASVLGKVMGELGGGGGHQGWELPRGSSSCPANELRVVHRLLWDEISEHLPPAERDEVKRVIGTSRIEDNRQVYDEATALAEILGEVRLETDECTKRRQFLLLHTPQREMVENDVRLLLDNIHRVISGSSASTADPRSSLETLVARDQKDRSLYNYISTFPVAAAAGAQGQPARPATPRTPPSRPVSSCGSRPSTAGTGASHTSFDSAQVIEAVHPKLNAFDIDGVAEQLREAFRAEHEALLEDVEYLHQCLEGETELRSAAAAPPPPVAELSVYGEKLQKMWLKEEEKAEHVERVHKMMQAADSFHGGSAGKLRTMIRVAREDEGAAGIGFRSPSRRCSFGGGSDVLSLSCSGSSGSDSPHPDSPPGPSRARWPGSGCKAPSNEDASVGGRGPVSQPPPARSLGAVRSSRGTQAALGSLAAPPSPAKPPLPAVPAVKHVRAVRRAARVTDEPSGSADRRSPSRSAGQRG